MSLSKLQEMVKDRETWYAAVHGKPGMLQSRQSDTNEQQWHAGHATEEEIQTADKHMKRRSALLVIEYAE